MTKQILVLFCLISLVIACSSSESLGPSAGTHDLDTITIRGAATKGPLTGSTISIYALNSLGSKSGDPLGQAISVDGIWSIDISNPNNELRLIEAKGGEYIDESDPETDINAKRRITLGSDDVLQSILIPGETTAAINFFTYTLVENLRKEVFKSTNLVQAFNKVWSRAYNTLGFDPFTEIPADPIEPDINATDTEKTYALLIGGAAYAINNATIKTDNTQISYTILFAMVQDLADCQLDGFVDFNNERVQIPDIPEGLFDDIDIQNEITRFRNNNYEQYINVTLPTWDQVEFCNADPVLSQVVPSS